MACVEKFGLTTSDFAMGNPQAQVHVGGVKRRQADVQADPGLIGFELSAVETGKISGWYWEETIRPLVEKIEKEGEAAWEHASLYHAWIQGPFEVRLACGDRHPSSPLKKKT